MAPRRKTSKRLGNAPSTASADASIALVSGKIDTSLAKGEHATDPKYNVKLSFPEYGFAAKVEKKPCVWKYERAFQPRVEMEIVTGKKADKLGVPAGPSIRLCHTKNAPGPLIPVQNVGTAVRIGEQFLKCSKTESDAKECALKSAKGQPYKIAGSPRRKARR
jgi:hypothetical protein